MYMKIYTREREKDVNDDANFLKNFILACASESYHLLKWEKICWESQLKGVRDGESKSYDLDILGQDTC